MARYAIMRIKKRTLGEAAAMSRHALRETPVHHADPGARDANRVLVGPGTTAAVMARLRAALPSRRRRDAVPAVELFVGASPEALRDLPDADLDRYFTAALAWIAREFGGAANIQLAVVHRDEATPHMQVILTPVLDGKLNAKRLVGNRERLEYLQTSFAAEAGSVIGLDRGQRGSRGKHTSVRAFHAAVAAAGSGDALPPRIEIPQPLPRPGVLATNAQRAAFAEREKDRERAAAAARRRQDEIERLARIGLAVKGHAARHDLPALRREILDVAEAVEAAKRDLASVRAQAEAEARAHLTQIDALDRQASSKRAELSKLDADIDRFRAIRESERSWTPDA